MLDFNKENAPNPAKLINSLRFLGYDNNSALADICDNSWDASADQVSVTIDGKREAITIAIADNGKGMDEETLDQALRLGSLADHNPASDLGKYGMGLVTASLSICRRTEVITRQAGGPLLYSVVDVDEIVENNSFCKYLGPATAEAERCFQAFGAPESGTVIILSKCDHLYSGNSNIIVRNLRPHLGRVYREFLNAGKRLIVSGESVAAVDPMMISEGAIVRSDETYPVEYTDAAGVTQTEGLRIRIVLLPNASADGSKGYNINLKGQGFYVLRNFREVASAETLGLFSRHNDYNRVRAEIYFPSALDELMGVNFTKHQLKPKESIAELLTDKAVREMASLAKILRKERVHVENANISHEEASRAIERKANLLIKPTMDVEKRAAPERQERTVKEPQGGTKNRKNYGDTQPKEVALPCRFETVSMSASGPIYDAAPEGRTVVIQWNVDHPFYQRFILENQDNPSMITATDFLIYSLAAAELKYDDDDSRVMIENIRSALSSNMRTLLADGS